MDLNAGAAMQHICLHYRPHYVCRFQCKSLQQATFLCQKWSTFSVKSTELTHSQLRQDLHAEMPGNFKKEATPVVPPCLLQNCGVCITRPNFCGELQPFCNICKIVHIRTLFSQKQLCVHVSCLLFSSVEENLKLCLKYALVTFLHWNLVVEMDLFLFFIFGIFSVSLVSEIALVTSGQNM